MEASGVEPFLKKAGVSRSAIYAILRGESRGSGRTLERLAKAGVTLDGAFKTSKR